jgi:ABC-type phosphate/phosphonate transport system substrate-binding protein
MADNKKAREELIRSAEAAFDKTIALMMTDLDVGDNKAATDKMLERMRDKIFSALLKVRLGWKGGKRIDTTPFIAEKIDA